MSESTELQVPQTLHIEPEHHEPEPQQDGERKLTPREQAMARIAAHAEERRGQEIAQGAIYDAEARERGEALPEPAADDVAESEEPAAAVEHAPAEAAQEPTPAREPPPAPLAPQQPQLRHIVLNGQQIAVTDEQLTQLAQMGALAAQQLVQPPPAPVTPVAPPSSFALDDAKVREAVQRIQFGSPDEGTAALAGLIRDVVQQVPQAPAIDQQRLVAEAEQRAVQRIAAEQTHAIVRAEYPEIFKDHGLMALAQQRVQQVSQQALAEGRRLNDLDVYREAGNQVYDLLKLPRPGSQVATTQPAPQAAPTIEPTRAAKIEERKRAAPRNPQSVDRRSAVPEAPRQPTGSEIVNWIRTQRHQQAIQ
jgi:hypothetical protein